MFHHHFRVLARVPGLVSLLFWHPVPSSFPGSGSGSGACFPTLLESCSIILSWFRLGFRGLSPYSLGILFHHHVLFPSRVPGLVSLLFWNPVLLSFPGSGACLPTRLVSRVGFQGLSPYSFAILFHHHFLVPAGVPGLVSLFPQTALELNGVLNSSKKPSLFHLDFLVPGRVPGLSP